MSTLPFLTTAALTEQGGDAVDGAEEVPCSIWPAVASQNTERGRYHTHRGEASIAFAVALRTPNRSLTDAADGEQYKIVSATPNTLLPHVVLELLQTSGRA